MTAYITASKPALQKLRDYLAGTLDTCRRRAEQTDETGRYCRKWDGWFKEDDGKGWQRHMEGLVSRLDGLLSVPGDEVQIYQSGQVQTEEFTEGSDPVMGSGPLF